MNTVPTRRGLMLLAAVLLLLGLRMSRLGAQAGIQQPTLQPTETAVPLVTPTNAPTSTPAALPTVDWADLSAYKLDMKPAFEGDVDKEKDANRYLIVANVTIETDAIIRGAERVRYKNRTPDTLNEIVFRLYPNTPMLGGHMTVSHVTLGNQVVTPVLSDLDSVMTVPLDQPLKPGSAAEMTVDFTLVMSRGLAVSYGRFGYVHDVISATAWYPTLSVYDVGKGWWKAMPSPIGDPAYTETGLYDVRLTLPADMAVVMSGKEIETRVNEDGTITHRDVTGPMRDHAFLASTRYSITPTDVDGERINVVHYKDQAALPGDATARVIKYASDAMHVYAMTFGDYPFKEFDVVENPTPTGVEFPGLVQVSEQAWSAGSNFLEIIVIHETGHQWFYSVIGDDQVDHPWLDEGMARYCEFVYVRAIHPEAAQNYIGGYQRQYAAYTGKGQPDLPVDLPVSSYNSASYGIIVYNKGALFIVELERELGQDTVNKALREYFQRYKYAVVTSADMERTFEDVSGKNLDDVFRQWVGNFPGVEAWAAAHQTPTPAASQATF